MGSWRNLWKFLRKVFSAKKQPNVLMGPKMYSSTPIDVPFDIGQFISGVVNEFGKKKGIDAHSWYHNASVWLLRKQEKDIVRTVEINLFDLDDGKNPPGRYFCLIPNIFQVKQNEMKTQARVPLDLIKRISWLELRKWVFQDPPNTAGLEKLLDETWSIAEKLDLNGKNEITYPIRKGYFKTS